MLQSNESLEHLNISSNFFFFIEMKVNPIKDKGVGTLSKALRYNFNLKVLDLNQVGLTDFGLYFLVDGLQYNFYLEVLNLRNNSIQDKGAFLIGVLIKNNNQLKDLDVSCEF
jgi:Ran GTPase-activating protein (RanGAP) involved in mRNA processing and transport